MRITIGSIPDAIQALSDNLMKHKECESPRCIHEVGIKWEALREDSQIPKPALDDQ